MTRRTFLQSLAAQAPPPSVLVLISDQLNAGVTSVYGGPVPTPNLERLARRGLVFTEATCPAPFCSPSRASLVTGQWPHAHGIVYNCMRKDYPAAGGPATEEGITVSDTTYDSVLHARGYLTRQYGKWHLSGDSLPYYGACYGEHREYAQEMASVFAEVRRRPREQWMDWYGWALPVTIDARCRNALAQAARLKNERISDFIGKIGCLDLKPQQTFDYRVADHAIAAIGSAGSRPFSITCSFNWPHDPNVIPRPYYERFDPARVRLPDNHDALHPYFENDSSRVFGKAGPGVMREFLRIYYASVAMIDEQVGRVLDALETAGRGENTIIVFTADHGDMAGGHGMAWKSTSAFYDEIVRVPLIVSAPGRVEPGRSAAAASLTDLAPTILALAGVPAPAGMQGRSLLAKPREYSYCERVSANPAHTRRLAPDARAAIMIRGGGWKYSEYPNGTEFLYHLARDPGETCNLAAERAHASRKEKLRQLARQWQETTAH
ncbi:MAG: sulfatase [Bryobacteraceae bacterium]